MTDAAKKALEICRTLDNLLDNSPEKLAEEPSQEERQGLTELVAACYELEASDKRIRMQYHECQAILRAARRTIAGYRDQAARDYARESLKE